MSRTKTTLLVALGLLAGASGTAFAALPGGSAAAVAAVPCAVDYKIQSQWDTGFTAAVTITNNGAAKSSWSLKWSYGGTQKVTSGWNAKISQSGTAVTAANESYNGALATGGTVSFGFNGTFSGTNSVPATFTLDGVACNVDDGSGGSGGGTGGDTGGGTGGGTGGDTGGGTGGGGGGGDTGSRVDNPYAGAKGYVNPEWSAHAAAEPGGSRIANQLSLIHMCIRDSIWTRH